MQIAYTTTFNAEDMHNWSGTPYYMSHAFAEIASLTYIGSLKRQLPPFFKAKQFFKKWLCSQRESPRFNVTAAKNYSSQVAQQLINKKVDVVISPLINPIAYLECKAPIILWTDALYASLIGFYAPFNAHSTKTIQQANQMVSACLSRCRLAIFSSDWAARNAIELYGVAREKVKVVPFGANLMHAPTLADVKKMIADRPKNKINLLFLAKSWERKGGDVVLAVTESLHRAGVAVELHIVGYTPNKKLPSYVTCHGFISKYNPKGMQTIEKLFANTHFLFVPSKAEAYGIVFCEANAFGVPCLSSYIGGISSIIKDNVNGMTFALEAPIELYCDYICKTMQNRNEYENLALSAYKEFATRLNWQTAILQVKGLIEEII